MHLFSFHPHDLGLFLQGCSEPVALKPTYGCPQDQLFLLLWGLVTTCVCSIVLLCCLLFSLPQLHQTMIYVTSFP